MLVEPTKISEPQINFLLKLARSSKLDDYILQELLKDQVHMLTREKAAKYIEVFLQAMKISQEVTDANDKRIEYLKLLNDLKFDSISADKSEIED